jgi:hypothetical protein
VFATNVAVAEGTRVAIFSIHSFPSDRLGEVQFTSRMKIGAGVWGLERMPEKMFSAGGMDSVSARAL